MPRWLETTMTRSPARLRRAIDSTTPGSRWKRLQSDTYSPSGGFRLRTPSRSKKMVRKTVRSVVRLELSRELAEEDTRL